MGTIFISSLTSEPAAHERLIENTVFSGFKRFATCPTSRSPTWEATTGGNPASFGVGDDDRLPAFDDGDDGVGRAQVDSDDFAHERRSLFRLFILKSESVQSSGMQDLPRLRIWLSCAGRTSGLGPRTKIVVGSPRGSSSPVSSPRPCWDGGRRPLRVWRHLPEITARRLPAQESRASSPQRRRHRRFATERRVVVATTTSRPCCAGHHRHRGRRLRAALRPEHLAHPDDSQAATGQRAGASTITQRLARNLFRQANTRGASTKVLGRKMGILSGHSTPSQPVGGGQRRGGRAADERQDLVPHGGGRPDVFQQIRQGRHARRGGDDCRHHPDARAPQPVRQPRAHARTPQQLRAAADGGRGLRHAPGGHRGRAEADRRPRPGRRRRGAVDGRLLRGGHPQEPRTALRRRGALRDRPAGADDARRRAAARGRARRRPRPAAARQAAQRLPQGEGERGRRQGDAADLRLAALDAIPSASSRSTS